MQNKVVDLMLQYHLTTYSNELYALEPLRHQIASGEYEDKHASLQSLVGRLGALTGAATKRLKIRCFMSFSANILPKVVLQQPDTFTMTLGENLARNLIGRSINKKDLMSYYTTQRTAANKIDIEAAVEAVMDHHWTKIWQQEYEILLSRASEIRDDFTCKSKSV